MQFDLGFKKFLINNNNNNANRRIRLWYSVEVVFP